jgi:hypothetical protein
MKAVIDDIISVVDISYPLFLISSISTALYPQLHAVVSQPQTPRGRLCLDHEDIDLTGRLPHSTADVWLTMVPMRLPVLRVQRCQCRITDDQEVLRVLLLGGLGEVEAPGEDSLAIDRMWSSVGRITSLPKVLPINLAVAGIYPIHLLQSSP